MVRGRTTAPAGLILGHEITGEVIEAGRDVEFIKEGDLVSVPFNIACGRCRNCKEGKTGICLTVNPARPGAAYGYVDMGGWVGGQAEYVMVPYADFNLLKFPDKDQAMEKIKDLTLLSRHLPDRLPRRRHGRRRAGHRTCTSPAPARSAWRAPRRLPPARRGRRHRRRHDRRATALKQAKSFGCETIDLDEDREARGRSSSRSSACREVDCAVDCVGFEARGHGKEAPARRPPPC